MIFFRTLIIIFIATIAGILVITKAKKQNPLFLKQKPALSQKKTEPKKELPKPDYAPGEVLVKFKPDTPKPVIEGFKKMLQVQKETYIQSIQVYHWRGDFKTQQAIEQLTQSKYTQYAEPNYTVKTQKSK